MEIRTIDNMRDTLSILKNLKGDLVVSKKDPMETLLKALKEAEEKKVRALREELDFHNSKLDPYEQEQMTDYEEKVFSLVNEIAHQEISKDFPKAIVEYLKRIGNDADVFEVLATLFQVRKLLNGSFENFMIKSMEAAYQKDYSNSTEYFEAPFEKLEYDLEDFRYLLITTEWLIDFYKDIVVETLHSKSFADKYSKESLSPFIKVEKIFHTPFGRWVSNIDVAKLEERYFLSTDILDEIQIIQCVFYNVTDMLVDRSAYSSQDYVSVGKEKGKIEDIEGLRKKLIQYEDVSDLENFEEVNMAFIRIEEEVFLREIFDKINWDVLIYLVPILYSIYE